MTPMAKLPDPARRSFRPPFCPNPECGFHQRDPEWSAQRFGFFLRPSDSVRIQRFRCPDCGRTFSTQTFSTTYWLRMRSLLVHVAPKAVELGMAALIRPFLKRLARRHPAYRRSLKRLRAEEKACPVIDHTVTSSTERRTSKNPLLSVNLIDLLLRHSNANHRRETIAFSKRRQGALERMAAFTVWRNCIKKRQEKESWPTETAAEEAGLAKGRWSWRRVLGRRLFPGHGDLPPEWVRYYYRKVKTLALGDSQTVHNCSYAF